MYYHSSHRHLAQDCKAHDRHVRQLRPSHNDAGTNSPNQSSWNSNFQHRSHHALSKQAHIQWSKKHLVKPKITNPRATESFYYSPTPSCRTINKQRKTNPTPEQAPTPSAFDRAVNTHVHNRPYTSENGTGSTMLEEHTRYAENLMYLRTACQNQQKLSVPMPRTSRIPQPIPIPIPQPQPVKPRKRTTKEIHERMVELKERKRKDIKDMAMLIARQMVQDQMSTGPSQHPPASPAPSQQHATHGTQAGRPRGEAQQACAAQQDQHQQYRQKGGRQRQQRWR